MAATLMLRLTEEQTTLLNKYKKLHKTTVGSRTMIRALIISSCRDGIIGFEDQQKLLDEL